MVLPAIRLLAIGYSGTSILTYRGSANYLRGYQPTIGSVGKRMPIIFSVLPEYGYKPTTGFSIMRIHMNQHLVMQENGYQQPLVMLERGYQPTIVSAGKGIPPTIGSAGKGIPTNHWFCWKVDTN